MKSKLLMLASALSISTLMLSGCSWFSQDKSKEDEPSINVDESDLPKGEDSPNPENVELGLPSNEIDKHSQEDVAEVKKITQNYIVNSLSTPKLLSGKWWEDGHDLETLSGLGDFSDGLKDDIEDLDPTTGLGAQTTQSVALFLAPSEDIKPIPKCVRKDEGCSSDPFFGKAKWKSVNKKSIQVDVSASVTRDVLYKERSKQVIDTYTYSIGASKSKKNGWVISQIKNSYTIGKFTGE